MKQRLYFRCIQVVRRDQRHARIDSFLDLVPSDVRNERLDTNVAHLDGILDHQRVDVTVAQPFYERIGRIESDERVK